MCEESERVAGQVNETVFKKVHFLDLNCKFIPGWSIFCFSCDLNWPKWPHVIVWGNFIRCGSSNDLKRPKNDLLMTFNWFSVTELSVHYLLTKYNLSYSASKIILKSVLVIFWSFLTKNVKFHNWDFLEFFFMKFFDGWNC